MTVVAAGSSVVIGIVQVVAGCITVQQQVIAIVLVKIAFAGIMTVVAAGSSVVIGIAQVVAGCIIVQQQVIAIVLVKIAFADMMRVMLLRVIAFAGMM
jgi:hypothetical protein